MSDYMFMLESHLSAAQNRVVAEVQTAAGHLNASVFLTGGALRDMLGSFPIHGIDFTVEGSAAKLAREVAKTAGVEILSTDESRKSVHLVFPGGVRSEIGMARVEKYGKPGGKPQVQPASIHEDLRGRDFTVNSIALSLNPASRGLLLDPNNGAGDLQRRELRTVSNYTLYDDPIRLFRLLRLKVRLGFTIEERTQMQYQNAREAELEKKIPPAALLDELRSIASEPDPGEVLQVLEQEKLVQLFSPALEAGKLNLAGFQKLHKIKQLVPFGAELRVDDLSLFWNVLSEKLTPKERAAVASQLGIPKVELDAWQKLETRAKKLEKDLAGAKLNRPSLVYGVLAKAPGELIFYLALRSPQRVVQDRIRNYFQKYLPSALEITEKELSAAGVEPSSAKFEKKREELIAKHLDARPKKVPPPEAEAAPPAPAPVTMGAFGRK